MTLYQRTAPGVFALMDDADEIAARADPASLFGNDSGHDILLSAGEVSAIRAEWAAADAARNSVPNAQAAAMVEIDRQAELSREAFLTPGSGQALEYQATADEAAAAAALPDPLTATDWPMLNAELQAQTAAGVSPTPTIRDIVNQITAQQAGWVAAGSAIKEIRRTAKLQVGNATTLEGVAAIVAALAWPVPPT